MLHPEACLVGITGSVVLDHLCAITFIIFQLDPRRQSGFFNLFFSPGTSEKWLQAGIMCFMTSSTRWVKAHLHGLFLSFSSFISAEIRNMKIPYRGVVISPDSNLTFHHNLSGKTLSTFTIPFENSCLISCLCDQKVGGLRWCKVGVTPVSLSPYLCARLRGNDAVLLVCERCDKAYHTHCLTPPLDHSPSSGWSCKVSPTLTHMQRQRFHQGLGSSPSRMSHIPDLCLPQNCRICRRCGVRSSGQWANHPFLCESCDPALPCPVCDSSADPYNPQETLTCVCCYRYPHRIYKDPFPPWLRQECVKDHFKSSQMLFSLIWMFLFLQLSFCCLYVLL